MTNYSTNLSDWGASGEEYPSGYSYVEGEAPVDDWDNFLTSNLINDVQHLISVTNERLDSTTDTQDNRTSNPTMGELFFDQSTSRLQFWDGTVGTWRSAATKGELDYHEGETNNPHSVTLEQARSQNNTVGNTIVSDAGDSTDNFVMRNSNGDELRFSTASSGWFSVGAYDSSATYEQSIYNIDPATGKIDYAVVPAVAGDDLVDKGEYGDGGGINADMVDGLHANELGVSIEEDGAELVGPATAIDFTGFLNVTDDGDGTVTVDPTHNHDSRYVDLSGDTMTGTLTVEGDVALNNGNNLTFDGGSGFPEFSLRYEPSNTELQVYDPMNSAPYMVFEAGKEVLAEAGLALPTGTDMRLGGQGAGPYLGYASGANRFHLASDGSGSGLVRIWDESNSRALADFWESGQVDFSSSDEMTLPKRSSDPSGATVGSMWYRTDLD